MQSADFQVAKRGDGAKGNPQETTAKPVGIDYTGTYYIANEGNNDDNGDSRYSKGSGNNYYLCPSTDKYQNDENTPFLTTYQHFKSDQSDAAPETAKWRIEFVRTDVEDGKNKDYYHIIHVATGQYAVANGIVLSNQTHRKRIHLETTPTNDDDALFCITTSTNTDYPGGVLITSKTQKESNNVYWNPSGGNRPTLASFKDNYVGTIGFYSTNNGGSIWYFEDIIPRPTISITSDNNVEITCSDPNAVIYYTTDGKNPTKDNGTQYPGSSFDPPADAVTVKAIAVLNGEVSNVASIPVLVGRNHPQLIRNGDHAWNGGTPFFYMIPDTQKDNANTTSIPRSLMAWYFLNAGTDGSGNQLYYIVNATGDDQDVYLYRSDNNISIKAFDSLDDNGFKFYLKNSGTQYKIVPFGETAKYLCLAITMPLRIGTSS